MHRLFLLPLFLSFLFSSATVFAQTRLEVAESVFISAQRLQSSAAGQALAQSALRIAAGRPDLSILVRNRQDKTDEINELSNKIVQLAGQTGAENEARMAALEQDLTAARQAVAEIEAKLNSDFPEFQELTKPRPATVAQLQSLLKPDEALLMNYTDGTHSYVWAVSKTAFDWHRSSLHPDKLEGMVKDLRLDLSGDGALRAGIALKPSKIKRRGKSFARATAFEIYSELFKPLEPVFGQATHLMTVFQGPLSSLPPAVLVTTYPRGDDQNPKDLRDTDWLIKKYALTTLPSVGSIRALRKIAATRGVRTANSFIGFGDPVLGYRQGQGAGADNDSAVTTRGVYEGLTEVANLAPLPNTEIELREIAQIIGEEVSSVFLGDHATEANVKSTDLSDATVIAFATHGLLANGLPGLSEPALVFTPPDAPSLTDDALLTASEAATLKLSADIIILSACDTAGSDGTPGAEGLSGLARPSSMPALRAFLSPTGPSMIWPPVG